MRRALTALRVASVDDIRRLPVLAAPSTELAEKKRGLESFLWNEVYRHATVVARRGVAQQALREMFSVYAASPDRMPPKFRQLAVTDGVPRAVADYIAGMTDRFALEEHRRLTAG
jgi:dGTPase